MREFFRGWRRKVGCVTLVLACLLMSAWQSSRNRWTDILLWNARFCVTNSLAGLNFYWGVPESDSWIEFSSGEYRHEPHITWDGGLPISEDLLVTFRGDQITWHYCLFGVTIQERQILQLSYIRVTIPHLEMILPLAIVAAYLLLWNPSKIKSRVADRAASEL